MSDKRGERPRQVRTPEKRSLDEVHNYVVAGAMAHLRGEVRDGRPQLGPDMPFVIELPFGKARYVFGSLVPIGSDGVFVPGEVDVDFSHDRSAPIRTLKIQVQQGIPQCTEIRLAARPDGRGLRPSDLEAIDLANWLEDILSECAYRLTPEGFISVPGERSSRKAIEHARRAGRRKVTPELLQKAAEVYRQNIDAKPIEAVRDEFDVSYRTAARYVELCRSEEYQLLPKTHQGKRKA
jgi:hypothetical protein